MPLMVVHIAIALAAFDTPVPATAFETDPLDALKACSAVADDARRLTCFEQATASLQAAVKTKEVVIISRNRLADARRRQFGLLTPEDPSYKAANVEDPVELKGKILSVKKVGQFYRMAIDGIGDWVTTQSSARAPAAGNDIVITRGALGSYKISYNYQVVRVRRIQ